MRKSSVLYLVGTSLFVLVFIEFSFVIMSWHDPFLKTNSKYPNVLQKQEGQRIHDTLPEQYQTKFEGLDFEDLLANIKIATGRNLQVRIIRNKQTKTQRVTLNCTTLNFPTMINSSPAKVKNLAKKYVYVHHQYTDQLSKNTRAFLSLCAQAGVTGRKVVRPLVKKTKFGSDETWLPLETYYDEKHLENLLAAAGYASLVDKAEYFRECPPHSPNHVSVHFIDNSKQSMGFAKATFKLQDDFYKSIVKNASQKGWTECRFLDQAMKQTPGKQFCVNGDIINDWKTFEKDIAKLEKCLNIFLWRGIDGVTYRLKFSEDDMKFSSIDLTYALKPGLPVRNEVERFSSKYLPENYIAVYMRSEFFLRKSSLDHIRKCVDLVLEVVIALKSTTGLSHVYVATDMGDYGSAWLVRYRSLEHLDENVFKDIHDHIIEKSKGAAYTPPSDTFDRGSIALVDMTLISRAQYLISAGTGTFQQWIGARFLQNHRNDKQSWSKITVC